MKTQNVAFILLAIILIGHFSCSSRKDKVSVRIDGWGNDTILIDYYLFSSEKMTRDTVYTTNGRFYYTPPVDELMQVFFYRKADMYPRRGGDYLPSTRKIDLTIEPGVHLTVKGKARADAVLEYTVKGSQFMEDLSQIRMQTLRYEEQKDNNEFGLIAAMERSASKDEMEAFFARRRELNAEIANVKRTYIRAYPNRELAAVFVMTLPIDSIPTYYSLLTAQVKEGQWKAKLDSKLASYDEYQAYLINKGKEFIGHPAPNFTLTDIKGNTFILSGFDAKGKYTVLDFWGSWCGPCLAGMPEMKKYYERYSDKLEIISIACNDKDADWRKVVSDNQMAWIQLFNDDSSAEKNVAVLYTIGAYPTKVILSPDKTVLAVFNGEGRDFYEKLDELLK